MVKVSLIIPTFNRPHLPPRAVESALGAGSDVEVIVVDDASSDSTASVCAALRGIKYVRLDRNQGAAGARNVGLLQATNLAKRSTQDETPCRPLTSCRSARKARQSG